MADTAMNRLVPYETVKPGREAVYSGKPFTEESEDWPLNIRGDSEGNEILEWSLHPWLWPELEEQLKPDISALDAMQSALGPLDDEVRKIRAQTASLVPCDNGLPVTVDELLRAIGDGRLPEKPFHDGCMLCSMWWEDRTTQPGQTESMRVIELYRQIPGDEPSPAVDAFVREQAFADVEVPTVAAAVAPAPRPSRAKWFALAATVIFAAGVGVGYGAFYLQSATEHEQIRADQAAEPAPAPVVQDVEASYEAAAAEAAKAARLAEEAEVEAKRLEGSLEEKAAMARAKKLAEDAEKAKAKAKGAAGKASKAAGGGGKAAGKGGGKKKKSIAEDPLGADFEL